MNHHYHYLIVVPLLASSAWAADPSVAQSVKDPQYLEDITVTATIPKEPSRSIINPKTAIQPIPAQDGADLLKIIPNVSVIRKGGSSGDPLLRGLGGSRLSILADGQYLFGGCGGRMDPPTSYIFPASYDEVIVVKGPQTVTQGPGMIGGGIQFVRHNEPLSEKTATLDGAITAGSADRYDGYLDGMLGNEYGWLRLSGSYNKSGDYKDGGGERIHSKFKRHNQILQGAITPTANTLLLLSYDRSRGEAAYADRMMDGTKFDRDAWSIKWDQRHLTDWFDRLTIEYGDGKVDHVMDNFSLRELKPDAQGNYNYALNNPDRRTKTGRIKGDFTFDNLLITAGWDWSNDRHRMRPAVRTTDRWVADDYKRNPFVWSQKFKSQGLFAEATWYIDDRNTLIGGYRHDRVTARYNPNFSKGLTVDADKMERNYHLNAAFLRYEHQHNQFKYFIGYGMAERSPDFWERMKNGGEDLNKERNREINLGVIYEAEDLVASVTLFGSEIKDYILIDNNPGPAVRSRNIDAKRYGVEGQLEWRITPEWTFGSSLAYTYGKNRTDQLALAQVSPLEWRSDLRWSNEQFSVGAVWRVVAAQDRYAKGQGNIAGQDIGRSGGFGVVSLHGSWKVRDELTLQGGVDNLFNKEYSEFVNRSSFGDMGGLNQIKRVNEPGRKAWLRLQINF